LTSTDEQTRLAYLLMVCDEIQEWERERVDADSELSEPIASAVNAKKATELVGICFKQNYAYLVVNHELKDHTLEGFYQNYLTQRVALQKSHFPIRATLPELEHKSRDEALQKALRFSLTAVLYEPATRVHPAVQVAAHTFRSRLDRIQKLDSIETRKHLLVPSNPPIYEVYIDHRIDDEPFLRTVFPI
jgi:hypothetical protein